MARRIVGHSFVWLVVALLLTANLMVGARLYQQDAEAAVKEEAYDMITLLTTVTQQIRQHYVDPEKTSYKDLIYGALDGMLQSLDAHSQFLDPDMYSDMKEDTTGQFGGLGIVISLKDNVLTIVAPMEGTPGFDAGLLPGDKVIEIEGESTEGLSLPEAVKRLRGEPGTAVTIKILRPKTQEFEEVTIVREEIEVPTVKGTELLGDGLGYVRITQFNDRTAEDLQSAIDQLLEEGMQALILDLRNNPGGLLSAAIEVSQKFLTRGDLIVYTQGRDAGNKQQFRARGRHRYPDIPLAILINGGSASASEIVAGALQDHNRAILVGEKSFGKGSVQSVIGLDDGSAIRLTTAKYYTPSEQVIHERGIAPRIEVPMDPDAWRKLMIARSRPAGAEVDEEEESYDDVIDVQLDRAIDVLKGIMVFEAKQRLPRLFAARQGGE